MAQTQETLARFVLQTWNRPDARDNFKQIFLATRDIHAELTITSFTAVPTQGTVIVTNVPVNFTVAVKDQPFVQSVQWDFDGDNTVDDTTQALTYQFTDSAAGTFNATVTVDSMLGGEVQKIIPVTVLLPGGAISDAISKVQGLSMPH
jgi:PKD repeat protein